LDWGKSTQRALDRISVEEARQYVAEGHFAPGSMLPKVEAIIDFVESTSNVGLITDPAHILGALYEGKGTTIVR
jgi:carbamate kinase